MFRDFVKGAGKIAAAIVAAALILGAIGLGVTYLRDSASRREAKPFEEVKTWNSDLQDSLGMKMRTRTKVVGGMLHAELIFDGYPPYLSLPWMRAKNAERQFTLSFRDQDGFRLFDKTVPVSDFTLVLGQEGKPTGLKYEFTQFVVLDDYKRWSSAQIGWNLDTQSARDGTPEGAGDVASALDHCAPGLTRAERLKRLSTRGQLRETSKGQYEAGGRSVAFHYDGELMFCR